MSTTSDEMVKKIMVSIHHDTRSWDPVVRAFTRDTKSGQESTLIATDLDHTLFAGNTSRAEPTLNPEVFYCLRNRSADMIGLTSRPKDWAEGTQKHLARLGLSLTVIYDQSKGPALLKHAMGLIDRGILVNHVVFLDDQPENQKSVKETFESSSFRGHVDIYDFQYGRIRSRLPIAPIFRFGQGPVGIYRLDQLSPLYGKEPITVECHTDPAHILPSPPYPTVYDSSRQPSYDIVNSYFQLLFDDTRFVAHSVATTSVGRVLGRIDRYTPEITGEGNRSLHLSLFSNLGVRNIVSACLIDLAFNSPVERPIGTPYQTHGIGFLYKVPHANLYQVMTTDACVAMEGRGTIQATFQKKFLDDVDNLDVEEYCRTHPEERDSYCAYRDKFYEDGHGMAKAPKSFIEFHNLPNAKTPALKTCHLQYATDNVDTILQNTRGAYNEITFVPRTDHGDAQIVALFFETSRQTETRNFIPQWKKIAATLGLPIIDLDDYRQDQMLFRNVPGILHQFGLDQTISSLVTRYAFTVGLERQPISITVDPTTVGNSNSHLAVNRASTSMAAAIAGPAAAAGSSESSTTSTMDPTAAEACNRFAAQRA